MRKIITSLAAIAMALSMSSANAWYDPTAGGIQPSSESGYSQELPGEYSSETGRQKTTHVRGYNRKDGTHVQGHYRS